MKPPLAVLRAINHARENPTEDTVEGHLVRRCKELRIPCLKLKGIAAKGWFDRVVFWRGGRPGLIELKRPIGARWQSKQERTRDHYRALGYDVQTLYTKDAVDEYVDGRLLRLYPKSQAKSATLRARRRA